MVKDKIIIHCNKCGYEITPEQTCYQISTGSFEEKDVVFRANRYDFNKYFHEDCLDIT